MKRALASVAKITEAGNSVHLSAKDPHIMNEKTKEKTTLRKEGNVYVMDLWVKVPSPHTPTAAARKKVKWHPAEGEQDVDMGNVNAGFARRGR